MLGSRWPACFHVHFGGFGCRKRQELPAATSVLLVSSLPFPLQAPPPLASTDPSPCPPKAPEGRTSNKDHEGEIQPDGENHQFSSLVARVTGSPSLEVFKEAHLSRMV